MAKINKEITNDYLNLQNKRQRNIKILIFTFPVAKEESLQYTLKKSLGVLDILFWFKDWFKW